MKAISQEHGIEALIGLAVVLLAAWFLSFAWHRTGGGAAADAIRVKALFANASGVNIGTDVRVAGLKIGTVTDQRLDPQSYQVETTLALNPDVKIPADSSAAITSAGLLSENFVSLIPGGDPKPLKTGDTIVDTQGAVDLMSMVGQFVNRSGGTPPPADNAAAPAGTP